MCVVGRRVQCYYTDAVREQWGNKLIAGKTRGQLGHCKHAHCAARYTLGVVTRAITLPKGAREEATSHAQLFCDALEGSDARARGLNSFGHVQQVLLFQ